MKLSLYWNYICGLSDNKENASNMDEEKWHGELWKTIFNPKKAIKIITNIVVWLYSYCSSIHLYLYGHKYCSEQKIIDFLETFRATGRSRQWRAWRELRADFCWCLSPLTESLLQGTYLECPQISRLGFSSCSQHPRPCTGTRGPETRRPPVFYEYPNTPPTNTLMHTQMLCAAIDWNFLRWWYVPSAPSLFITSSLLSLLWFLLLAARLAVITVETAARWRSEPVMSQWRHEHREAEQEECSCKLPAPCVYH